MPLYKNLNPGDPAPWFHQRSTSHENFAIDIAAGRYIVLCFFVSTGHPRGKAAVDAALACSRLFDDTRASFFGVSIDPKDEIQKRIAEKLPGYRFFWDFDARVSKLYGAVPHDAELDTGVPIRRIWVVLDPTLRILKVIPFQQDGTDAQELVTYLANLPPPSRFAGIELQAPILLLPNVFEPEFCDKLISLHEQSGGEESGFMVDVEGKTVLMYDHGHKRRKDHTIEDPEIIKQTEQRFSRRVSPEILKAYQFKVTFMERHIVSCYLSDDGGHFCAHRDNTTKGTAHRRFAVSVNLNSDFDGGEVSFPEYGPKSFKPPPGGAVVFSCSLLHAVSRVTRGRRYAFLPFLYDDEASKIREANSEYRAAGVSAYKSD